MKIAVISNLHANLPALDAVLNHAREREVEAFWCLGDLIGYHPHPDLIISRLQELDAVSVLGDFDRRVLKFPIKKEKWRLTKRSEEFLAVQWASENLSPASLNYLENLPEEIKTAVEEVKILLVHGDPCTIKEGLTSETSKRRFLQLSVESNVDIVISGHSHLPFYYQIDKTRFFNPGSVGSPFDGDPRASYLILEMGPKIRGEDHHHSSEIKHQFFRVEYDVQSAVNSIRRFGLPEAYAQCLLRGQNLEMVLVEPERWVVSTPDEERGRKNPRPALQIRPTEEDLQLEKVIQLIKKNDSNLDHIHQVTFLALSLFDKLQPLHRLGPEERYWLHCGALLHDIGKHEGNKNHHKTALAKILREPDLPFTDRERHIISLIARYHRKAWPQEKHNTLVSLPAVDQRKVAVLASLLRVADGLDSPPRGNVQALEVLFTPDEITITCLVKRKAAKEKKRALGKGELLEFTFDRILRIEWHRA